MTDQNFAYPSSFASHSIEYIITRSKIQPIDNISRSQVNKFYCTISYGAGLIEDPFPTQKTLWIHYVVSCSSQ